MPSTFVWYDLMTPDLKGAESFYATVAGWTVADAGFSDRSYTLASVDGPGVAPGAGMVGGLMATPEHMSNVPPTWNGHIGVEDVDAFAERLVAAGGIIHRAPEDIPHGIGRFAVVADPGGATFILFQRGNPFQTLPPPPPGGTPGFIGWNELHAADGEAAWEFYSGLFGWTKAEAVDMGPMGLYQTFAAGSHPIGGMMTKVPEMPAPTWLFYINVDSIDAAAARIAEAGGRVVRGPHQVPGGSWIVQAIDPQGAFFAVTSATR